MKKRGIRREMKKKRECCWKHLDGNRNLSRIKERNEKLIMRDAKMMTSWTRRISRRKKESQLRRLHAELPLVPSEAHAGPNQFPWMLLDLSNSSQHRSSTARCRRRGRPSVRWSSFRVSWCPCSHSRSRRGCPRSSVLNGGNDGAGRTIS